MSEIQNTRDLVLTLRLIYTRAQLATMLGVSEPTVTRWEMKRAHGGTNARSSYRRAFNDAILTMVNMLEKYGIEVKDFPTPIVVARAKTGRDGRLMRLTKVALREVLRGERLPMQQVIEEVMAETGAKTSTIQAAAKALGVVRTRKGFGAGSIGFWELPIEERGD